MTIKQKVIVILGPTATGKSDLAVKIAKRWNGEIISADSRQVYRGLNIGTGKITRTEMKGVPHHLLNVTDPKKQFSVIEFRDMANAAIRKIVAKGKVPILCGGTGFYISALIDNVDFPDVPPNNRLRKELAKLSPKDLLKKLSALDPKRYASIDRKNIRRVIRAIEIATSIDRRKESMRLEVRPPYSTLKIGIKLPPEILRERIYKRLIHRMDAGMVSEAKRLHTKGLSWKRMDELGLEYRYLAKYLQGDMTKDEMIEKLNTEIWRYSKRQMTWFKRDRDIHWLNGADFKSSSALTKAFLSHN